MFHHKLCFQSPKTFTPKPELCCVTIERADLFYPVTLYILRPFNFAYFEVMQVYGLNSNDT